MLKFCYTTKSQSSTENAWSTMQTPDGIAFTYTWLKAAIMVAICLFSSSYAGAKREEFANDWAVQIKGGIEIADFLAKEHGFVNLGKIFQDDNFYLFRHHSVKKRSLQSSSERHAKLAQNDMVLWVEQQQIKRRVKRSLPFDPDQGLADPLWKKTWYLLPTTQPNMKVTDAWEEGYTGKGVVVTILDDGIEYSHPDLRANYDKVASSDINDHDDDPKPRQTYNNENRHGTRCAGEVAAVANNDFCSAGIAFNAFIGGVRMLDGSVTDSVEAQSIGLRPEHIDIYSASWGPDDDGKTVDGPAKLAKIAFQSGVKNGRKGKGSIFVWASGNGGKRDDNCNCDGYTNSIYTLSISSTTQHTDKPWYSEACSSTLAATYSSGTSREKQIVTTDLSGRCTESHTGTSASAPLAAGICALALEANKNLTWRDMQHLVVRTANPQKLRANDWITNAVGRNVSHSYGYGLMDAHAMVLQAKNWLHVPQQRICEVKVMKTSETRTFSSTNPLKLTAEITKCDDGSKLPDLLEHVQAKISISSNRRGDLAINLTSAMGTTSKLLDRRRLDYSDQGFHNWPFMTTHSWDENPSGKWTLVVKNTGSTNSINTISSYTLVFYGTYSSDWPAGANLHSTLTSTKTQPTSSTTKEVIAAITGVATPSFQKTSPTNCKTPIEAGTKCLVCKSGFLRSHDKLYCLEKCPIGFFAAYEKASDAVPRAHRKDGSDDEDYFELLQESGFEEEERFVGSQICTSCNAGPYCLSCSGPGPKDCANCIDGFQVSNGHCSKMRSVKPNRAFILTIAACILSVILFILVFVFLNYCRSSYHASGSKSTYKYIRNEQEVGDLNDDPFEDDSNYDLRRISYYKKKGTHSNGGKFQSKNGWLADGGSVHSKENESLLGLSDSENGLFVDGSRT